MAATTTGMKAIQLVRDTVAITSTNYSNSTVESTNANARMIPGGLKFSTYADVIQIQYSKPDGKMVIFGQIDGCETAGYIAFAVRNPPTSDGIAWRAPTAIGTSTAETGWQLFRSTAALVGSSGRETFVAGPFESARYGHLCATSTNYIDVNSRYLEFQVLLSTVASTGTWVAASTNAFSSRAAGFSIIAFEVP
jgi:hypothetical protein